VSTIELILDPNTNGSDIEKTLNQLFNNQIRIKTRVQLNDALYKMLNTENIAVYLIFTLILIIALFNIIGSIIMMILDKQENIKTFHSLGATSKDVRQIFFLQGVLMTLIGGAIGLIIGVILVVLQHQFSLVMITPSLAYPVDLRLGNVMLVMLTITVLGIIASKIASHRVKNNS
jgi:lipoprotein-releasing system permease protein